MKYELKDYLPEVKKKEEPEMVKITMTVPRQDYEDIDSALKLSGHAGGTKTAYGRAAFAIAAKRARELINQTKQNEGKNNEYQKCSE